MRRALLLLPLFLATTAVVWSGLNWPPPLWIVEYGLPGAQGPTGRVARIEGIEFVEISPGSFRMGSDDLIDHLDRERKYYGARYSRGDVPGRLGGPLGLDLGEGPVPSDEMPVRWVALPRGLWVARTEVTHRQVVDIERPDWPIPPELEDVPVSFRQWADGVRFCEELARRCGLRIRLPSEAEWECACRAGGRGEYSFGDNPAELSAFARYHEGEPIVYRRRPGLSPGRVGTRKPNRWGLYDLHGNLYEWCADPVDSRGLVPTYVDFNGPFSFDSGGHAIRGGSYLTPAWACRASRRAAMPDWKAYEGVGVRPVFTLGPGQEHLVEPYLVEEARGR